MDIKYKKNAHILIKSDSGLLKVDHLENIRRVSFLGRFWFLIKDWYSSGRETLRLNNIIEKTLDAVNEELASTQVKLSLTLNDLPSSRDILNFHGYDDKLKKETKQTIIKVCAIVQKLILRGNGGFHILGIPNYNYRTECFNDLPQAVLHHSQTNERTKTHPALNNIKEFFSLRFIQDEFKRELVHEEIRKRSHDWVG